MNGLMALFDEKITCNRIFDTRKDLTMGEVLQLIGNPVTDVCVRTDWSVAKNVAHVCSVVTDKQDMVICLRTGPSNASHHKWLTINHGVAVIYNLGGRRNHAQKKYDLAFFEELNKLLVFTARECRLLPDECATTYLNTFIPAVMEANGIPFAMLERLLRKNGQGKAATTIMYHLQNAIHSPRQIAPALPVAKVRKIDKVEEPEEPPVEISTQKAKTKPLACSFDDLLA